MEPIWDHIKENLLVLFVGFNPSVNQVRQDIIMQILIIDFGRFSTKQELPKKNTPTEDGKLLEFGFGFTNIVHRPTKAAQEITKEEYKVEGKAEKGKLAFTNLNCLFCW